MGRDVDRSSRVTRRSEQGSVLFTAPPVIHHDVSRYHAGCYELGYPNPLPPPCWLQACVFSQCPSLHVISDEPLLLLNKRLCVPHRHSNNNSNNSNSKGFITNLLLCIISVVLLQKLPWQLKSLQDNFLLIQYESLNNNILFVGSCFLFIFFYLACNIACDESLLYFIII